MLSKEQLSVVSDDLLLVMQASIIVPMVVVWLRKQHFSPAVRRLSKYVYLSAFVVVSMKIMYPAHVATNYGFLTAFNTAKIALFGAVYHQVLNSARVRQVVLTATVVTVVCIAAVFYYDQFIGVSFSRIIQCAVLAGFALAYLEQSLNYAPTLRITHDPLWLLSVGQLIYSAGTVTAFSLEYLSVTIYDQSWKYIVVALVGLVFNAFLTLAFLRANRGQPSQPEAGALAATRLTVN